MRCEVTGPHVFNTFFYCSIGTYFCKKIKLIFPSIISYWMNDNHWLFLCTFFRHRIFKIIAFSWSKLVVFSWLMYTKTMTDANAKNATEHPFPKQPALVCGENRRISGMQKVVWSSEICAECMPILHKHVRITALLHCCPKFSSMIII